MKFSSALPMIAALLASTAAVSAGATSSRAVADRSAIADYVRARAADQLGELDVAAKGYAAALAENPQNTTLALRVFRQSIAAGDMALATRTAIALDQSKSLPPDGALLLLTDAIARKNWKGATAILDRLESEKLFAFVTPVARGWIAFGSKSGDPLAPVLAAPPGGLAATYATEHKALLLIATGKTEAGLSALAAIGGTDAVRAARLRIATAATLNEHRKRDEAMEMLSGDSPAVQRARATIEAKRKLPGAIDTPQAGIAELFVRIAADINKEQAAPLALEFTRMAAFLAPQDSEAWLTTAGLLNSSGAPQAALDALARISPDDAFIGAARDARLTILAQSGRKDEALAEAQAATKGPGVNAGDWARLGDMLAAAKHYSEASNAYQQALTMAGGDKAPASIAWPLLLQQGNALMQAQNWPAAKSAVEKAVALAPEQPDVLNFLGYSELERGEDVAGAGALIAKASQLAPDDPSITDSLGWSWYLRGDLGKAVPLLERASKGAPADADINEHLGDAYWKIGRKLAARYAWRAALVAAEDDQKTRLQSKIDYGATGKP